MSSRPVIVASLIVLSGLASALAQAQEAAVHNTKKGDLHSTKGSPLPPRPVAGQPAEEEVVTEYYVVYTVVSTGKTYKAGPYSKQRADDEAARMRNETILRVGEIGSNRVLGGEKVYKDVDVLTIRERRRKSPGAKVGDTNRPEPSTDPVAVTRDIVGQVLPSRVLPPKTTKYRVRILRWNDILEEYVDIAPEDTDDPEKARKVLAKYREGGRKDGKPLIPNWTTRFEGPNLPPESRRTEQDSASFAREAVPATTNPAKATRARFAATKWRAPNPPNGDFLVEFRSDMTYSESYMGGSGTWDPQSDGSVKMMVTESSWPENVGEHWIAKIEGGYITIHRFHKGEYLYKTVLRPYR